MVVSMRYNLLGSNVCSLYIKVRTCNRRLGFIFHTFVDCILSKMKLVNWLRLLLEGISIIIQAILLRVQKIQGHSRLGHGHYRTFVSNPYMLCILIPLLLYHEQLCTGCAVLQYDFFLCSQWLCLDYFNFWYNTPLFFVLLNPFQRTLTSLLLFNTIFFIANIQLLLHYLFRVKLCGN